MGLFDRRKQETEVRDTTPTPVIPPVDDVLLRALLDGETITREKALTIPYVAGAVDFISNTIASMPIKLYKVRDGKVEEVEKDSRVKLLNGDTGDTLDAFQMKKAMVTDYLMGKGGYCYIRKFRNEVTGLYYVEDMYISILRTPEPIYKDYQIMVMGKAYKPFEFIKLLRNTKDGASGVGLTVEIGKELETAYQTLLYQLGMVKAGGNKRGFLQASRKLGQDEINVLKNAWRNLYGNSTENIVVLNNGVEFKEASNSSVEMQMNESKKTLRDEINGLFHIYPNDFDRTYKEAIYPIVKALETALNRDLLLEKEKKNHFYELDVKEILRVSIKERYESYKLAKETGFLTLNEIRRAENLDYIEGLDVVNVGLGAVLYDTNRHVYYTPNTDKIGDISDGSSDDASAEETDEDIDKMLEGHELAEEYDESGNSAVRYNENHDAKTGRFAPSNGGGGGGADNSARIAELEKEMEEAKGIFAKAKIKTQIDMLKENWQGTAEEYTTYKKKMQEEAVAKAKAEKEAKIAKEKAEAEAKAQQEKKQLEEELKTQPKEKVDQYKIIQETNPMNDDYHVGIRKPSDIKTWQEVVNEGANDGESFSWGDFSESDAKEALKKGKITIYSSYPIDQGVFVSTSKMQAEQYAGGAGKKVYSKTVPLADVAWINGDEGQFAKIKQKGE